MFIKSVLLVLVPLMFVIACDDEDPVTQDNIQEVYETVGVRLGQPITKLDCEWGGNTGDLWRDCYPAREGEIFGEPYSNLAVRAYQDTLTAVTVGLEPGPWTDKLKAMLGPPSEYQVLGKHYTMYWRTTFGFTVSIGGPISSAPNGITFYRD